MSRLFGLDWKKYPMKRMQLLYTAHAQWKKLERNQAKKAHQQKPRR